MTNPALSGCSSAVTKPEVSGLWQASLDNYTVSLPVSLMALWRIITVSMEYCAHIYNNLEINMYRIILLFDLWLVLKFWCSSSHFTWFVLTCPFSIHYTNLLISWWILRLSKLQLMNKPNIVILCTIIFVLILCFPEIYHRVSNNLAWKSDSSYRLY